MITRDCKETKAEKMNMERTRELAHIQMVSQGASERAKAWFRRPAYSSQGVK